ncbi:hypothetical protein MTYP_03210 [Methylophilaceae bacterium]|nr:hypothetical protein MTYP_03210 [Methylophilaceae bacterium]
MQDQLLQEKMNGRSILPVTELRKLLADVSESGTRHLLEVESDLMQTTYLLGEAIDKLGKSFTAIHQAVSEQQLEIEKLLQRNALGDSEADAVREIREVISDEVHAAVTGMQFHDMTSQLITRTLNRVKGLRELLAALATHGEVMGPEHEHEDIARLLEEMSSSLKSRSIALDGGLRQSVRQQHMGTGDIELF